MFFAGAAASGFAVSLYVENEGFRNSSSEGRQVQAEMNIIMNIPAQAVAAFIVGV
jgi:hypothetical protein